MISSTSLSEPHYGAIHRGREITSKGSAATLAYLSCLYSAETARSVMFEGSSYRRVPEEFMQMGHVTSLSIARSPPCSSKVEFSKVTLD